MAKLLLQASQSTVEGILNKHITRGIIPDSLKEHFKGLSPSDDNLDAIIEAVKGFPKSREKKEGSILAEGVVGSGIVDTSDDEKQKTDTDAGMAWISQERHLTTSTPLSGPQKLPNNDPTRAQLVNYLKSNNMKTTGARDVLAKRALHPSADDQKKLSKKDSENYLIAHGVGIKGNAAEVVARAMLIAKVHYPQKNDNLHKTPKIDAYLAAANPKEEELDALLSQYRLLPDKYPPENREKENIYPESPNLTSPTPVDQFGISGSPSSSSPPPTMQQNNNSQKAKKQQMKRRINNLLLQAATFSQASTADVLMVIRETNSDGKDMVTVMGHNVESTIDLVSLAAKSVASTYDPEKYPVLSKLRKLDTCVLLKPGEFIKQSQIKKRKISFQDAPFSENIIDPLRATDA